MNVTAKIVLRFNANGETIPSRIDSSTAGSTTGNIV